ncbi:MAG: COP23 domain-containing protein [Microcoleus sp.]
MKQSLFAKLLALFTIASITPTAISQSSCPPQRNYCCVNDRDGVPITRIVTARGVITMIRWVRTEDLPADLTPQHRCQQVSEQLQAYRDGSQLKYITGAIVNGQPAICVAKQRGGDCLRVLFNLKPGSDPKRALKKLLNQRGLSEGRNPLFEGGSRRFYLDMNDYLNEVTPD